MQVHQDHPTSLPKGPLRSCLERLHAEIVSEMNHAQSRPNGGAADIELAQLRHWVNRLTEAIHFNGQVPSVISGENQQDDCPGFRDLDDAIRELGYIGGQPLHAAMALEKLGKHRNAMYQLCCKVIDELERFGHRLLTFDIESAKKAVQKAHDIISTKILGRAELRW